MKKPDAHDESKWTVMLDHPDVEQDRIVLFNTSDGNYAKNFQTSVNDKIDRGEVVTSMPKLL